MIDWKLEKWHSERQKTISRHRDLSKETFNWPVQTDRTVTTRKFIIWMRGWRARNRFIESSRKLVWKFTNNNNNKKEEENASRSVDGLAGRPAAFMQICLSLSSQPSSTRLASAQLSSQQKQQRQQKAASMNHNFSEYFLLFLAERTF